MYATVADMIARYGELELIQLTDRARTGNIDASVVNTAIADAVAEIDGYLNRYDLPLPATPPELLRVACDIAHYRLCGVNNTLLTDEIIKRYDRNVAWLDKLSTGKVNLSGVINTKSRVDDTSDAVQFSRASRVFARKRGDDDRKD